MKAIVYTRYGPPEVLRYQEIATPAPQEKEVLVKVCAASVNPLDWRIMRADPFVVRFFMGFFKPKHTTPGSDFAGRVEAVGHGVTQFRPGDAVFGMKGFAGGAFAEYVCATENELVLKPANVSFEDAAAAGVAALTALQGLRDKGRIKQGQSVLVDGASGGVGTFAIQIAKSYGTEVTAVCSTRNLERARLLGADPVIDYTREDFTRLGVQYDLILAANARHSILDYRRALREGGICVKAGGKPTLSGVFEDLLLGPWLQLFGHKQTCSFIAKLEHKDLVVLANLLESGKVVPVIERRYGLSETADAVRYLEEGHAQGKVVVTIGDC
jgi:NADPH:quinone reductase-like Zn-dependent oxidoreductase